MNFCHVTVVTAGSTVFWNVFFCRLVEVHQCFRGMNFLHAHGQRITHANSEKQAVSRVRLFYQSTWHHIPEGSTLQIQRISSRYVHCKLTFHLLKSVVAGPNDCSGLAVRVEPTVQETALLLWTTIYLVHAAQLWRHAWSIWICRKCQYCRFWNKCLCSDCGLLCCDMWPSESTSTLKIEAEDSSKTFITTHKTTRCDNPKDIHINFHHCENLVWLIQQEGWCIFA
jgi:hypothetical protein